MTHTRYAFVKANWHAEIVTRALEGFCDIIPAEQIEVFDFRVFNYCIQYHCRRFGVFNSKLLFSVYESLN